MYWYEPNCMSMRTENNLYSAKYCTCFHREKMCLYVRYIFAFFPWVIDKKSMKEAFSCLISSYFKVGLQFVSVYRQQPKWKLPRNIALVPRAKFRSARLFGPARLFGSLEYAFNERIFDSLLLKIHETFLKDNRAKFVIH